ncbi:hypothetical protein ACROYT_G042717 [Oculina patagonica]
MNSKKVKAKNGRLMEKSNCYICGKKKSKFIKSHSGGALARRKGPSTVDKIAYVASNFITPSPSFASMARLLAGQALKGVKDNVDYYRKGEGIDIHKAILKVAPKKGFVIPGHKYTGPGNPLEKQVKWDPKTGKILKIYEQPTGKTDAVSMQHDVDYSVCTDKPSKDQVKCKNEADKKMVKALDAIPWKDRQWGHAIARNTIATKAKVGKAVVIERFNRTLKNKMYKQFTIQGNTQYLEMLPILVKEYNNTKHSSIKMTPTEASKEKNQGIVYLNLYGDMEPLSAKPKFKVGDKVRISKYKRKVFDKGYTPNWSEEIFIVDKIQYTNPITYKLKDLNNEEIQGSFYESELLKAKQEVFRIDKVIRRNYKKKQALVKWKGYSDEFNSWIPIKDLQHI